MKLLIRNLLTFNILIGLMLSGVVAQEGQTPVCGTDEYYEAKKQANPQLQKLEEQANEAARAYAEKSPARSKKQQDTRVIPVVFHVVHEGGEANIDEEQILATLETMNKDFQKKNADTAEVRNVFKDRIADYNIEFRRARVAPDGSCTDGITRTQSSLSTSEDRDAVKSLIQWNTDHYLNIWIVKNIGGDRPIAGFAQFPWDDDKETDGIVTLASEVQEGNRTLTHEVGHYLGLYHPFYDTFSSNDYGQCPPVRYNDCTKDNDKVCDVPPVERREEIIGCSNNDLNTCPNISSEPDMVENFMDYTLSTCQNMFTDGQKARSEPFITLPQFRQELFSEENIIRTGVKEQIDSEAPLASFQTPNTQVCVNTEVQFDNLSCAGTADSIEWRFEGGTPAVSNAENPVVTYDEPGEYDVFLRLSNSNGADTLIRKDYIQAIEPREAPVNFTFEESNLEAEGYDFEETAFGYQWKQTSDVGLSGNKCLYLGNYNIREESQDVRFTLPPVDLTTLENPVLRFDMSYATKNNNSNDQLILQRSEDCGQSWEHMNFFFNSEIVTKSNVNSPFYPENYDDWKTHEYSLSQLQSSSNSKLRFELQTGQGNNVFIDNVRIESRSTSIEDQEAGKSEAFQVYPNPVNEVFEIEYTGNDNANGRLTIANAVGKTLQQKPVDWQPGETKSFNVSSMNMNAPGLYIIRIQYDKQTVTKRITLSE